MHASQNVSPNGSSWRERRNDSADPGRESIRPGVHFRLILVGCSPGIRPRHVALARAVATTPRAVFVQRPAP